MPRMLTGAGILTALFAPTLALAAYNDVTLTTDTVLTVNGVTLNVSGSSAAVESITVNATNFSVTMPSGSSFQVTAPNLERLTTETLTGVSTNICSTNQSILGYQTTSSVTATITPVTPTCASASSGGGGGGGGGGGSGASSTSVTSTVSTTLATSTTVTATTTAASATTTTPAVTATATTPAVSASGLSASQIQSIIDVLVSFDVDAVTLASVRAALNGPTTGSVTSAAVQVFKSNLTVGSLGSEVKALQQFLNSHGYPVAASGAGSPGNETTRFGSATKAALIKFQKAKGIIPAVGYFGQKTRAAVNAGS